VCVCPRGWGCVCVQTREEVKSTTRWTVDCDVFHQLLETLLRVSLKAPSSFSLRILSCTVANKSAYDPCLRGHMCVCVCDIIAVPICDTVFLERRPVLSGNAPQISGTL